VQCLYDTAQSDFATPLYVGASQKYGSPRLERDILLKLVDCNPNRFCFLVQNPTKNPIKDICIGFYLSNNAKFNLKEAILAQNRWIALSPKQQKAFSETLQTAGYKYLHVVPVKAGRILGAEIETVPIF
jgi:hypothetical protein